MNKKFIVILILFIFLILFILFKNKDITEKFSNDNYCNNSQLYESEKKIIKIKELIKIGKNEVNKTSDAKIRGTIQNEVDILEKE